MADQKAVRILHRVLCMAVKLLEVEYGLGKQGQGCSLCQPQTEVIILERKTEVVVT